MVNKDVYIITSQFVDKHAISRKKINCQLNYFVKKRDRMQNVFVKSFLTSEQRSSP